MAVTQSMLEVKVTIENKQAIKSVSELNTGIENLGETSKSSTTALNDMDKSLSHIDKNTRGLLSSYSKINDSFSSMAGTFNSVMTAIQSANTMLDIFTNPKNIKRVSNVVFLLSKFSGFKGFSALSGGLDSANGYLEQYNKFLIEAGFSETTLDEKINKTVENLKLMQDVIAITAGVGIGSFSLFSLAVLKNAGAVDALLLSGKSLSQAIQSSVDTIKLLTSAGKEISGVIGQVLPTSFFRLEEAAKISSSMASKEFLKLSFAADDVGLSIKMLARGFSDEFGVIQKSFIPTISQLPKFQANLSDAAKSIRITQSLVTSFSKESIKNVGKMREVFVSVEDAQSNLLHVTTAQVGETGKIFDSAIFTKFLNGTLAAFQNFGKSIAGIFLGIIAFPDALAKQMIKVNRSVQASTSVWNLLLKAVVFTIYSTERTLLLLINTMDGVDLAIGNLVASIFKSVFTLIKDSFFSISSAIKKIDVSKLADDFKGIGISIVKGMEPAVNQIARFKVGFQNAQASGANFLSSLMVGLRAVDFKFLADNFQEVFSSLVQFGVQFGKTFGGIFIAGFRPFLRTLGTEFDIYKSIFTTFDTSNISKSFSTIGYSLKEVGKGFLTIFKNIPDAIMGTVDSIKNVSLTVQGITSLVRNFGKYATSNFLIAAETAGTFGNALTGIGLMMANSENGFIKFMGVITTSVGVFLGGFNTVIAFFMASIGESMKRIGDYLGETMKVFEEKFRKAQISVVNFDFTIRGFTREFGTAIGTAEEWNKVIDEISQSTLIDAISARKMSTEIIQVGNSLGLSKEQMFQFAKLIPNYVKAGDDAYEITIGFLQALTGMGQSVIKYGLHVSDAAVEHSAYAKAIGLSFDALNDEQKAQARMATIFEQSAAVEGRATEQLKTMAGAQQLLSNRVMEAQAIMGKQNFIIQTFYTTLASLAANMLQSMPAVFTLAGGIQDLLTVVLKVAGGLISIAMPLVTVTTLMHGLQKIIAANGVALLFLQTAINGVTKAASVQAIAITSLGTLFQNIALISKGLLVKSLGLLGTTLLGLAVKIKAVTIAVLTNPLFWKAAAIAATMYFVIKAFQKIEEETRIFSEMSRGLRTILDSLSEAFSGSANSTQFFGKVFETIIAGFSIGISYFLSGIYAIIAGVNEAVSAVIRLFGYTTDEADRFTQSMTDTITKLSSFIAAQEDKYFSFESKAYAGNAGLEEKNKIVADIAKHLSNMKTELVSVTEKEKIFAEIMGTPAEALLRSKVFQEDSIRLGKTLEDRKKAAQELVRIDAEMIKMARDSAKEALSRRDEIMLANLDQVKSISNITKKYAINLKKDLEPLRKSLADLRLLPNSKESQDAIQKTLDAITSISSKSVSDQRKEMLELKTDKILAELDYKEQLTKFTADESAIIKASYAKRAAEINSDFNLNRITSEKRKQLLDVANKEQLQSLGEITKATEVANYEKLISISQFSNKEKDVIDLNYKKKIAEANADVSLGKITEDKKNTILFLANLEQIKGHKDLTEKLNNENIQQKKDYLALIGDKEKLAELNFQTELDKYNKMLEERKISDEEYFAARKKLEQQKSSDLGKKTGIETAQTVVDAVSGGVSGIVSAIGAAFGPEGILIATIVNLLNKSQEEMSTWVHQIVQGLIDLIPQVVSSIPIVFREVLAAIPDIFNAMLDGLRTMFSAQFWADMFDFSKVGKNVAKTISRSYSSTKTTGAGSQVFAMQEIAMGKDESSRIGGQIITASKAGAGYFTRAWEALKAAGRWLDTTIFQPIIGAFTRVFTWVNETIFQPIIGGFLSAFQYAWDNLLSPFVTAIGAVFSWVWNSFLKPFTDLLSGIWQLVWDSFLYPFIKWLGDSFQTIWANFLEPFIKLLVGTFTFIYYGIFKPIVDLIKAAFTWIWDGVLKPWIETVKTIFTFIWDTILEPWYSAIKTFFVFLWDTVFSPIIDAFKAIGNFFIGVFSDPVAAFNKLGEDFKAIGDGIIAGFKDAWESLKKIGGDITKGFSDAWESLKSIGADISNAFKDAGAIFTDAAGKFSDAVFGLLSKLGTAITSALEGVGEILSGAGVFVVNGIMDAFAKAGNFLANIFKFEGGGQGTVEKFLGFDFPWIAFAEGGAVPGRPKVFGDSSKNDIIPALLSPGEIVLPRSLTTDKDFMKWLSMILNQGKVGKFGSGGIIDAIGSGIKSAVSTVAEVIKPVTDVVSKAVEWVVPDWIQGLYDSIKRFISSISLKDLVLSPKETLEKAIKDFSYVFSDYFKMMMPKFQYGGVVPGSGFGDSFPAMLAPGEFVLNRNAVGNIGVPLLDRLNTGQGIGGFSSSGTISSGDITVNLTINTEQPIDVAFIKTKVLPIIQTEMKRASIDGKRVLATGGVR